ncbi:MAG: FecR family protein [Cyclobacteriaceae bacterium]
MTKEEEKVLEFLLNDEFKKWVLDPNLDRNTYWNHWFEQHPDELHFAKQARNIINELNYAELTFSEKTKQEILANIIRKSAASVKPQSKEIHYLKTMNNRLAVWSKVAAVISFLIIYSGLIIFTYQRETEVSLVSDLIVKDNPVGKRSVFVLPDGSKVTMNAGSKISFNNEFGLTNRTLNLEGEAYFEVVKNIYNPFIVKTRDVETTALGTSFGIRAYAFDEDVKVALESGEVKVKLIHNDGDLVEDKTINLLPGEGVSVFNRTQVFKAFNFNPKNEFVWKDGVLVLKNSNFSEMKHVLETWYGVKIEVVGRYPANWKINGRFDNETLDQVLKGLNFTHGIEYEIKGEYVELNLKNM